MLFHKTYETDEQKDAIIAKMSDLGFVPVSTEGLFVGKGHLLFDNGKPEPKPPKPFRDLGLEVDDLKARLTKVEEYYSERLTN